jgi:hypothetical protein
MSMSQLTTANQTVGIKQNSRQIWQAPTASATIRFSICYDVDVHVTLFTHVQEPATEN